MNVRGEGRQTNPLFSATITVTYSKDSARHPHGWLLQLLVACNPLLPVVLPERRCLRGCLPVKRGEEQPARTMCSAMPCRTTIDVSSVSGSQVALDIFSEVRSDDEGRSAPLEAGGKASQARSLVEIGTLGMMSAESPAAKRIPLAQRAKQGE